MTKAVGLAFVGGFLIGVLVGMFLMSCLIASSDK